MKLEERLIQLRTENDLSQSDLAERMCVSRQTISRWENGATIPSAENIRLLSQLYGISADALLHGEPSAASEPEAHEAGPVGPVPESAAPARRGSRRKLVVLLAVVLVIGAIVGVIWWGNKESNADDDILTMGNLEGASLDQPDEFFHLLPME